MPVRLPGADALGQRPTPQSGRGVTGFDAGGVGRAIEGLGNVVGQIGEKYDQEQDAQAVFAARRKLDDWERANVYDPEKGAIAKRGRDAFELPKTLPGEFDTAAGEIGAELTSQRQRTAFQQMAQSRREQLGAWADRHALQQRDVYDQGQYQADIAASSSRAALLAGAGDLDTTRSEIAVMQSRTVGFLRGKGKSEEEIAQEVKNNTSKVHVSVLNQMLDDDKPLEADKYLKDNASGMNVEDLLSAKSAVGKQMDARLAIVAATEVVQGLKQRASPGDMDRLTSLVRDAESGGRRFGADGKLLQGPVTRSGERAQGEMQVMPSTAADPGYGIKPADPNNPDDIARVGREKLGVLLKRYGGNVPQALAAYNWGEGNVDRVIRAAKNEHNGQPGDWFGMLPQETQAYVTKIGKAYGDGDGAPTPPTLEDVHTKIRQTVGIDNPRRLQAALAEGTRQFNDMMKAKKDAEDQAEAAAMKWQEQNGGRVSAMPASLRANLTPKALEAVIDHGKKVAKGDDITDPIVFQKMATDDAFLKGMTDAQFYTYSRKLSESDWQQMANRRGQLLNKQAPQGQKPTDLDTAAVKGILDSRLIQMGIDPTPSDTDAAGQQRVGAIRVATQKLLLEAQVASGKKFDDAELTKRIDGLIRIQVGMQSRGFFGGVKALPPEQAFRMKPSDIPPDVRERLTKDFAAAGVANPTDGDILGAYLEIKGRPRTGATGAF